MTIQKISALVVGVLCACGVLAWAYAQAQSRHAQPVSAVAAGPSLPAAPASAAINESPQPAAPANTVAVGPSQPDCNPLPVHPKPRAKPKAHHVYRPEPALPPVAVAPPPVYSPPVVVEPTPIVVGSVVPYYYGYGYGYSGYPIASVGYYHSYGGRYWVNNGPRYAMRGAPYGRVSVAHGYGRGYRR